MDVAQNYRTQGDRRCCCLVAAQMGGGGIQTILERPHLKRKEGEEVVQFGDPTKSPGQKETCLFFALSMAALWRLQVRVATSGSSTRVALSMSRFLDLTSFGKLRLVRHNV